MLEDSSRRLVARRGKTGEQPLLCPWPEEDFRSRKSWVLRPIVWLRPSERGGRQDVAMGDRLRVYRKKTWPTSREQDLHIPDTQGLPWASLSALRSWRVGCGEGGDGGWGGSPGTGKDCPGQDGGGQTAPGVSQVEPQMFKALLGPRISWVTIFSSVYWAHAGNKRAERWSLCHDILEEHFLLIASLVCFTKWGAEVAEGSGACWPPAQM